MVPQCRLYGSATIQYLLLKFFESIEEIVVGISIYGQLKYPGVCFSEIEVYFLFNLFWRVRKEQVSFPHEPRELTLRHGPVCHWVYELITAVVLRFRVCVVEYDAKALWTGYCDGDIFVANILNAEYANNGCPSWHNPSGLNPCKEWRLPKYLVAATDFSWVPWRTQAPPVNTGTRRSHPPRMLRNSNLCLILASKKLFTFTRRFLL